MDATTFISLLIQKLQDLLAKEAVASHPSFVRGVRKAIEDLQNLLKQNQSLQDSEDEDQALSVPPAVYSAKDIIDSLLKRKEFQLQPTRKEEINGFKKMIQNPFTGFKSLHSQYQFSLHMKKLGKEINVLSCSHDHMGETTEAQTVNNIEDILIGFNNDSTSSSFLNEEGRQRRQKFWKRSFQNHLKEEESFVGLQQQSDELVDLLIPKKKSNSNISTTHGQSTQGTETSPAKQDDDQPTTQVNSEASKQDGDQFREVNDENGKTLDYNSDSKNSERDDKSLISPSNTCEEGQSTPPEKIYLKRFLNKKVIITLLQSLFHFIGDEVPEHGSDDSTTTVASDKKQEAAQEQDSNDSCNQAKPVNEVAGEDSGKKTQNHSDHQPPVPHSSYDHPIQEVDEENSTQDSAHHSNQVTKKNREETHNHGKGDGDQYSSNHSDGDKNDEEVFQLDHSDQSSYDSNGNSTNRFIAVIGEAGSGKSTLVRTVFNRADVKQYFTERAWFRVSSESKARDVFLSILKQTKEGISGFEMAETLSEEELMWILKKRLQGTNYLIVIEDVETPQIWRDVQDALNYLSSRNNSPGGDEKVNHGGKIIIISRKHNAISRADSTLRMSPLNDDDESWKLFSEKVQFAEDEAVKRQFKQKIIDLCGRLPLGIVLMAGLLCTKEVTDWSRVIEIAYKSTNGDWLALLSYQDLPSQVKPCFLYMALFPKEYEIPVRRLIHLWCAEGFVTPSTSEEVVPEDLAELYFQELVIRNMVQVRWRLDGSPITCRMHDHLHDIFSQRAVDEGFFYLDQLQSSHAKVLKQPKLAVRRLASAYRGNNNFPSSFIEIGNLRCSIVFDTRVQGTAATKVGWFLKKIIGNRDFGLLKVLDLEGVYKPDISHALEKLKLLSYLGLRSTFIHSLPDSVGNLSYLETLDLKHTKIRNLPSSIWKAKKLQHLYLNCVHSEIVLGSSFSESPSNLRTLWGLCIQDHGNGGYDFLRNLTRLRKLGLTCLSTSCSLEIIAQLTELQSLKVKCVMDDDLQLQSMEKNEKLREAYLMGELNKSVTDVRFFPSGLRVLTLCESGLVEDPMLLLGQLKELKILRLLRGSYRGENMCCRSGGFPKLHVMKLWDLKIRDGWTVKPGAMPCLRVLEICRCDFREGYDESHPQQMTGLQHLTTLKELALTEMQEDLGEEVQESLKKLKSKNVHIIRIK